MRKLFLKVGVILSLLFFFISSLSFPSQTEASYCGGSYFLGSTNPYDYCNSNYYFDDVNGQPYQAAVQNLSRMGIFFGYDASYCTAQGTTWPCFMPNKHITRWEAAVAIARYHVMIRQDWFAWDPATAQPSELTAPPKNANGQTFSDYMYGDPGFREAMTAITYHFINGGRCDTYYTTDGSHPGQVYVPAHGPFDASWVNGSDICFGAWNPATADWIFGFHGINRAGSMYLTTNPDNTITVTTNTTEECPNGSCYNFANGGDFPYYMTRADFATRMYSYWLDRDNITHPNYCLVSATATIGGADLLPDPANPSNLVCPIHAGQSTCSTPVTWSGSNVVDDACNFVSIDEQYRGTAYGDIAKGKTGTLQSDPITQGESITYQPAYNLYLVGLQNSSNYWIAADTVQLLAPLSFTGKYTSGSISFPGGSCTLPSAPNSTCSQSVSWSTSLIANPNTVTLKDITNNRVLSSNGLSGTTTDPISGITTFVLYENGVQIATQTVNPTKLRGISGTVNVDYNDNAAVDAGDGDGPFTEGTTVTLKSSTGTVITTTSNASGAFTFSDLSPETYNISIPSSITSVNYPDGLHASSVQPNPVSVTVTNSDQIVNFYISPYYRITGGVFIDVNKNGKKDAGENYYTTSPMTITASNGGVVSYPSNGLYSIARLPYGPQTITYTSPIPNGYVLTIPRGGAGSPSFTVQVGKTCAATPVSPTGGDGTCNAAGNIFDVNFGISNSTPWMQGIGLDMRFDGGLTNSIPSTNNACGAIYTMMPTNAGDLTTQGGVFIGSSSVNSAFGVRTTPSSKGWVMDSLYPETYKPVVAGTIRTSYSYLTGAITRAGITQTELSNDPNCTDPTVSCSPVNIASGVYTHDGNVTLSSLTVPANRNVILLIKGDLTITGAVTVPNTSTLTVAVGDNSSGTGGDILVDKAVGSAPSCTPPTGQIQGFFTADKNMTINGTNDCTIGSDSMLTIEGAVVVNAALNAGTFTMNRDLCANDTNYPAVMIKERPDFILHAPDVIKQQNYLFREAAP